MYIFRSFRIPKIFMNSTIAIGNFDGVHLGHQAVINKAKKISINKKNKFGVLTFEPHPKSYFSGEKQFFRLTPFREKYRILMSLGVDFMLNIKFSNEFLENSALDFLEKNLAEDLKVTTVVTGFDFVFGNKRKGDVSFINEYVKKTNQFQFIVVPEVKKNLKYKVSSSYVRQLLRSGNLQKANSILTRKWRIFERVIEGEKKARDIGFKTANVKVDKYCNVLRGVYMVTIKIPNKFGNKVFNGIANYGIKPTFNKSFPLLEVHIFNFNFDIYRERISIKFLKFIRAEKKFESIVKLKDQIIKDINQVKNDRLFKNN